MNHLVDTDILIELSKGNPKALEFVENLEYIHISIISAIELIAGARNKIEVKVIEEFISRFEKVFITEEISLKSYELFKLYSLTGGLSIPDAFIAATSITKNLILCTNNLKHFKSINGIKIKSMTN